MHGYKMTGSDRTPTGENSDDLPSQNSEGKAPKNCVRTCRYVFFSPARFVGLRISPGRAKQTDPTTTSLFRSANKGIGLASLRVSSSLQLLLLLLLQLPKRRTLTNGNLRLLSRIRRTLEAPPAAVLLLLTEHQ
jgi:hypothetical protein